MKHDYKVEMKYDAESGVWIATSEEIPGLFFAHPVAETVIDSVMRLSLPLLTDKGLEQSEGLRFVFGGDDMKNFLVV